MGHHLHGKQSKRAEADNTTHVCVISSASALKALALCDINPKFTFAVPAEQKQILSPFILGDPLNPPVPIADRTDKPPILHCKYFTTKPL